MKSPLPPKSQVLTLEYILLFALILTVIVGAYMWSVPVVGEMVKTAEINRVGNSLAELDKLIVEVSHQPGAIRELEIDLGEGTLEIRPPIIVYSITVQKSEPSPTVSGPTPIRPFIEEYDYIVAEGQVEIAGKLLSPGGITRLENGFVQLEDTWQKGTNPTFTLLSEKTLPARKNTKAGEEYLVELFLYYEFGYEGSGLRTGKALVRVSNENGVVKVEF